MFSQKSSAIQTKARWTEYLKVSLIEDFCGLPQKSEYRVLPDKVHLPWFQPVPSGRY